MQGHNNTPLLAGRNTQGARAATRLTVTFAGETALPTRALAPDLGAVAAPLAGLGCLDRGDPVGVLLLLRAATAARHTAAARGAAAAVGEPADRRLGGVDGGDGDGAAAAARAAAAGAAGRRARALSAMRGRGGGARLAAGSQQLVGR